ncbi:hypothetical protein [uncultured Desulfobulbus sp.]|uniref:hypothetical protein n=1 Tax=uncultured Desulfobulbus sp. TaxID=239745 RepID=UPI0029C64117|nr:hypothetical protein [uncultured Desulfobulbus sp.]
MGLLTWMPGVHAEEAASASAVVQETGEDAGPEHGKINTPDASPVDPGHFEIESSYTYLHSKRFWNNSGNTHTRGLLREQSFEVVGVCETS